jgi:hypothetical protein
MAKKLERCVTSLDERTGTITDREETRSQQGIYIALIIMEEPLVEPNRDGVAKGKARGYLLSEDAPPFWLRKERNRVEFTS